MADVTIKRFFKGDRYLWGLIAFFMLLSLLSVYSSSVSVAYASHHGNTFYFLRSQFIMLMLGLLIIVVTHWIPYIRYMQFATIGLVVAILLLVITLFAGVSINQATRWLEIPVIGLRLQTSDLAKVALVIYLARGLTVYQHELNNFRVVTMKLVVPVGIVCVLIMSENLSTAVMIFMISMIILFIGRIPIKFILAYVGLGVAVVILFASLLLVFKKDNNRVQVWKNRIEARINKENSADANYQANQANIAISTGKIFGKLPGKSTQRNLLPQSNSDFIFAIIVEEYGLFGAVIVIMAYLALMYRGVQIARKCDYAFPALMVLGLTVMIVFQAFLHMMVAVGIAPVTGQTLPMISWGRTSVIVISFALGAMLSVSRVMNARERQERLSEEEQTDKIPA
ncbi:MAG TPA: FtsW/RodA/SpoVE family cell cycle protein [Bacteroidales bacterium]|jgi:cell division protein FtsW|nr:FtsW/RodA/SpoVE family cell cycle protein [Bacteroidales bacterium]OPZ57238.1 MAG: Lipid II flippase FtsW [Bacteroidetes bacterium ADurb.BinA012]MZQ80018.1 FtsW/RodA/SpoVE family cell cycle protein [Bacteroidales bacterium]HHU99103.1 FtsW/RodA/SpoVE family cell cycle protein [Bacteroidales bacterium]HOE25148.1 FtsW/RodA/SpoVE family cell cycle protein [Bacteroidales bacterium]